MILGRNYLGDWLESNFNISIVASIFLSVVMVIFNGKFSISAREQVFDNKNILHVHRIRRICLFHIIRSGLIPI